MKRENDVDKAESTNKVMNNDAERKTKGMFIGNDGDDGSLSITDTNRYDQSLLWVHQTTWQQQLKLRYGNTISLIDATYKTTKYDLALFFICVKTNVGYAVVAEFIIQCESAQYILEALSILKQWNPQWNPQFFMCDYSEAELQALESAFPDINVYLCNFHMGSVGEKTTTWFNPEGTTEPTCTCSSSTMCLGTSCNYRRPEFSLSSCY